MNLLAEAHADPQAFIARFFTSFTDDLLRADEDASAVVDRYHVEDVVQIADGVRIDRERLVAHCRPIRKNRPESRFDVHEAIADGDRIAARYTLHVRQRGKELEFEVFFFGRFAADGRMRTANLLTRSAKPAG